MSYPWSGCQADSIVCSPILTQIAAVSNKNKSAAE
uniref:Uncharacterized protein n=1 Tax=Anguilla anguilla TaxID=7936 RepID=A0A0E9U6W7_ANGAN